MLIVWRDSRPSGERRKPMEDLASDCFIGNIQIGIEIGRDENGRIYEGKWEGAVVAVKEIHLVVLDALCELEIQWLKRCLLH